MGSFSHLHLVGKLGFDLSDKQLRRAGLDYWPHLQWTRHESWDDWWDKIPDKSRVFFFTTKSKAPYYQRSYQSGDWLVFGKETKGLSEEILKAYPDQAVTIPFPGKLRSFNLSNSVAMALGEGMRQLAGH